MSQIIACVPNISEGLDLRFIDGIVEQLRAIENLKILDVAIDREQNRTVLSFTGSREASFEAGFLIYEKTLQHVDMRHHKGEYPRIGAVDVFPFVPLKDATIEEAKSWADDFAGQVAERFSIPVYLFAESARYRYRRDIQNIRQGEYENFEEKMKDPRWLPDYGPAAFPADTGVTIIGARYPLVSFKAFLQTKDIEIAQAIGKAVADTSGGHVRAIPGRDTEKSKVYLSVAITNFKSTPLYRVIENIRLEGRRFSVDIESTEVTGLIPEIALIRAAEYYLHIRNMKTELLLEHNIQKHLEESFVFGSVT